jgi:hypothetical protein
LEPHPDKIEGNIIKRLKNNKNNIFKNILFLD